MWQVLGEAADEKARSEQDILDAAQQLADERRAALQHATGQQEQTT
jgi:hypothetical protein